MPMPPTTDTPAQITAKLYRNIAIGVVVMYGVTFLMCLTSMSAGTAAGVAVLPAGFAAPFLGGLITLISYIRKPRPAT